MFGKDMFSKLGQMQQAAAESKTRLNNIFVEGEAGGNLVIVTLNGNKEMKSVKINTDHKLMELEDLEDLLTVAFQRALEKANTVNEQEMMASARNFMPGM
jgi:DNA-binding YbaB/EbfC family protein